MSQVFSGYQCWHADRIGAVINKEALSVSRANFLATHVPLRHIAYEKSPQLIKQTDENSLLAELHRATEEDRHVFAAVKGIPGTGKSHLIRWLKEQYALRHPNDVVLPVARSNSSLRATIQQIIDSHLFDTESLPNQLKRLQSAVEVLTQAGLAERLLNTLQEATRALDWERVQGRLGALHRRVTPQRLEGLLLDVNVRERLKEEEGPIARVASFLTSGSGDNQGLDRIPGFVEADLEFDIDFLRRLRLQGAYREVHDFCNDLHQKTEIRQDTTRYLNYALHNYAISAATELAAGDLRAMFADLRRHLRTQGKSLALFIEDITAFTGIDEGLVEVLITQHTGEANAEYCRLTSIIGVTDGYYADRFPDNIRERITHVLTLNASGRPESDLMRDSEVRAEFRGSLPERDAAEPGGPDDVGRPWCTTRCSTQRLLRVSIHGRMPRWIRECPFGFPRCTKPISRALSLQSLSPGYSVRIPQAGYQSHPTHLPEQHSGVCDAEPRRQDRGRRVSTACRGFGHRCRCPQLQSARPRAPCLRSGRGGCTTLGHTLPCLGGSQRASGAAERHPTGRWLTPAGIRGIPFAQDRWLRVH